MGSRALLFSRPISALKFNETFWHGPFPSPFPFEPQSRGGLFRPAPPFARGGLHWLRSDCFFHFDGGHHHGCPERVYFLGLSFGRPFERAGACSERVSALGDRLLDFFLRIFFRG